MIPIKKRRYFYYKGHWAVQYIIFGYDICFSRHYPFIGSSDEFNKSF